jgi:hypothetical protein
VAHLTPKYRLLLLMLLGLLMFGVTLQVRDLQRTGLAQPSECGRDEANFLSMFVRRCHEEPASADHQSAAGGVTVIADGGLAETEQPLPEPRRKKAGLAAVAWIIANEPDVPTGWTYPFFSRLQRVVQNRGLATEIDEILELNAKSGRQTKLPTDIADPRQLRPARLTPILFELVRRKEVGMPYAERAAVIEKLIARNDSAFWTRIKPPQQCVYFHLFALLGIHTDWTIDQLIEVARESSRNKPADALGRDLRYLYTLTHLVLTRSGYFRRYVDAEEFQFAIPAFRSGLRHALIKEDGRLFQDVSSEILACFQLLKIADDELTAQTRASLLRRQNPDGSWGAAEGADRDKVHLTFTGAMATLSFPPQFRRVGKNPKRS